MMCRFRDKCMRHFLHPSADLVAGAVLVSLEVQIQSKPIGL